MCGIFGVFVTAESEFKESQLKALLQKLFILSESRGKEAAGMAISTGKEINVLKQAGSASSLIKSAEFKRILKQSLVVDNEKVMKPTCIIGHSRLVTNGVEIDGNNNQPVITSDVVGVHNGIVTNVEKLWLEHPELEKTCELDSDLFFKLFESHLKNDVIPAGLSSTFDEIEGAASVAMLMTKFPYLVLATNTGSLYFLHDKQRQILVFASERYILEKLIVQAKLTQFQKEAISKIDPQDCCLLNLETHQMTYSSYQQPIVDSHEEVSKLSAEHEKKVLDSSKNFSRLRRELKRCSRCVLPETMPFINFDSKGVCNFCRSHDLSIDTQKKESFESVLNKYCSSDGSPDCVVAFSGGRDSSYGLHYIKKIMERDPIAYTYDWGMITDLARRNQARMCGKLGVEQILISADIKKKRRNIGSNVTAWMRRPNLGMIPLFMAGDKQYFYHANKMRKRFNVNLVIYCGNKYEKTNFKTGFCGVNEGGNVFHGTGKMNKIKLSLYYLNQYMLNPFYFNRSFLDTLSAFYCSFMQKIHHINLFDYIDWNEQQIMSTLKDEYNWEFAADTDSSWRIGDGTAAFYNYIYNTVAGFTEQDTFYSNLIRDGVMERQPALDLVTEENQPRFDSIKEYADLIGVDFHELIQTINSVPKLYV